MGDKQQHATMPEIVLATLNARYTHASFGLRCLFANLGDLRDQTAIAEFDIHQRPLDIAESLLRLTPRIIGFGVYIWNVRETQQVLSILRRLRPDIRLVLGGPEVSYETDAQPIVTLADHVITGEADLEFARLCRDLLAGRSPSQRILSAPLPQPAELASPYDFYTPEDIAHRVVYVEASRGCPFTCEFCLSSLDIPVRAFPLDPFLADMDRLLHRGLRQFKFVDRTFNLDLRVSRRILEFFLERHTPGLFVHFEMIPDRLPEPLRDLLVRFPPGTLQFEVGIQTLNPAVEARIRRRQDHARLEDNFRFLRRATGVHIHADLIAGLPGETLDSFAEGFDRLFALGPQEIQVGILKRLRGTPIGRHDTEWGMVYRDEPPYDILESRTLDFATLQRLRRFARAWNLVVNSGNFRTTGPTLWEDSPSAFRAFLPWSDWLHARTGTGQGIALNRLAAFLLEYLVDVRGFPASRIRRRLADDFCLAGRTELPPFLREADAAVPSPTTPPPRRSRPSRRQDRHGQPPTPTTSAHSDQVQLPEPRVDLPRGGIERVQ